MDDCDQNLSVDSLVTFLQDSVFVEYFNSFLLLPSFPCHVYYDEQLGIFESVQPDCSTPSSSRATSTVYLTHSKLIQFANPSLCEEWVVTHRLPLFIHSDLYSEYRLLKELTKSASGFFDTCLQQQDKKTIQQDRKPHRRRHSVASGRLSARQGRRTSLPSAGWGRSRRISPLQEKITLLKSKTGMEMFKRFLAGKLGEENLMFWIEAESLKNDQKSIAYASGIKRLRVKYPSVFQQLSLSQRTLSTDKMAQCVNELQLSSLENLKQYWYPRFLVGEVSSSVSLPSVKQPSTHQPSDNTRLSYPATPTYRKLPKAKSSHQIQPIPTVDRTSLSMPHLPEPATRVKQQRATTTGERDTYRNKYSNRRMTVASTTVNTIDSNTGTCGRISHSKSSEGPRSLSLLDPPRTGGKNDVGNTNKIDRCKLSSRRIWSRDSIMSRDSSGMDDAITRSSRLAMYNRYPLVPCSRTSCNLTTLEQGWSRSHSPLCPPRSPQILSVSGTPVPMEYPSKTIKPDYKSLLKCLSLEKCKAGGFFQKHLELVPNKVNINCLYFWREVQEYKELFLQCSFSISSVEMKAKVIYGRYIFEGSSESISCPAATAETILERMWPAFEDLFDEAEEHVLAVLLKQWEELCELEHQLFESLHNVEPDNEISRMSFNDLGKLSEECGSSYASLASVGSSYLESENEDEDGDEIQVGAESLRPLQGSMLAPGDQASSSSNIIGNVNHENKDNAFKEKPIVKEMAFSDVMTNPRELEYFKMYLNDNKGAVHLMCWMEIEAFRAIPANDKAVRNMKAKQLRTKYFNKTYFFGPSSPATKEIQRQVVDVGGSHKLGKRPTSAVFREAQKHVRLKVEQFVRSFVKTSDFMERMGSKSTKKTGRKEAQINDIHSQSTRHVESHDTILLRKMLTCDEDKQLFQYFITAQTPEGACPLGKQVDFWLEVQRYKTMFHSQMNAKLLKDKMNAIITCYFQSCSPPRLQLNIPAQVAEETTKKKFSPYVFRESQAAVFRNLQSYWNEYQNFLQDRVGAIVNKVTVEEAIRSLKEQIAEERAKVKEMVEMEQMEQERTKLSVPRFESIEEKNQRLMKEKELKEFGEVGVSFRLSHLSPQFKFYFGDDQEGNITSL